MTSGNALDCKTSRKFIDNQGTCRKAITSMDKNKTTFQRKPLHLNNWKDALFINILKYHAFADPESEIREWFKEEPAALPKRPKEKALDILKWYLFKDAPKEGSRNLYSTTEQEFVKRKLESAIGSYSLLPRETGGLFLRHIYDTARILIQSGADVPTIFASIDHDYVEEKRSEILEKQLLKESLREKRLTEETAAEAIDPELLKDIHGSLKAKKALELLIKESVQRRIEDRSYFRMADDLDTRIFNEIAVKNLELSAEYSPLRNKGGDVQKKIREDVERVGRMIKKMTRSPVNNYDVSMAHLFYPKEGSFTYQELYDSINQMENSHSKKVNELKETLNTFEDLNKKEGRYTDAQILERERIVSGITKEQVYTFAMRNAKKTLEELSHDGAFNSMSFDQIAAEIRRSLWEESLKLFKDEVQIRFIDKVNMNEILATIAIKASDGRQNTASQTKLSPRYELPKSEIDEFEIDDNGRCMLSDLSDLLNEDLYNARKDFDRLFEMYPPKDLELRKIPTTASKILLIMDTLKGLTLSRFGITDLKNKYEDMRKDIKDGKSNIRENRQLYSLLSVLDMLESSASEQLPLALKPILPKKKEINRLQKRIAKHYSGKNALTVNVWDEASNPGERRREYRVHGTLFPYLLAFHLTRTGMPRQEQQIKIAQDTLVMRMALKCLWDNTLLNDNPYLKDIPTYQNLLGLTLAQKLPNDQAWKREEGLIYVPKEIFVPQKEASKPYTAAKSVEFMQRLTNKQENK